MAGKKKRVKGEPKDTKLKTFTSEGFGPAKGSRPDRRGRSFAGGTVATKQQPALGNRSNFNPDGSRKGK